MLKLNTDGASKTSGLLGGGGLIRNSKGDILFAFSHFYGTTTSIIVEARALLDGIKYLRTFFCRPVLIECDSKVLVQIINKAAHCPWTILAYVREIKSLILSEDSISHIFREANTVADLLASQACSNNCNSFYSSSELPRNIKGAARLDKLGMPSIRIM